MLGSIISGIGSVIGGLFGKDSQEDQIAAQKEFAQKGIRWRVEDAKQAGIHPLYALGAQTHAFSPVSVGSPLGEGIAAAGQEFGRAISAKSTQGERVFATKMATLQLQRGELENQLLASQIARMNGPAALPPPMPGTASIDTATPQFIPGQAQSTVAPLPERFGGPIKEVPLERTATLPGKGYSEPGAISDVGWVTTQRGGLVAVPSLDVKQRIEDQMIPELQWAVRNVLSPQTAPPVAPKRHHHWEMSPTGEWFEVPNRSSNVYRIAPGRGRDARYKVY